MNWNNTIEQALDNLDSFFPHYAEYDTDILPEDEGYDFDLKLGAIKLKQFKQEALVALTKARDEWAEGERIKARIAENEQWVSIYERTLDKLESVHPDYNSYTERSARLVLKGHRDRIKQLEARLKDNQ